MVLNIKTAILGEELRFFSWGTEALTPISDMAVLMGVPDSYLRTVLLDPDNEITQVYRLTKAQTALAIRKRDIELAEAGSPTAAVAVAAYLKQMTQDE